MSNANRRSFLKNTSLAALGAAVIPHVSQAKTKSEKDFIGCTATTQDLYGQGPFYTENPPELIDGQLAESIESGVKLVISGRVMKLDCSQFIEGAVVDIWHADDNGDYDNQGYNLRGKVTTNSEGFYLFETIKPGKYLISGGQFRPSHIHFKITPPNSPTLTTQLYFSGDEDSFAFTSILWVTKLQNYPHQERLTSITSFPNFVGRKEKIKNSTDN